MLTIHLPSLPLEALRPRWSEPGAYAVLDQGRVAAASIDALRSGVRAGMRAGGVLAIAPETILLDRSANKEQAALAAIAMALLQYTPEVAYADEWSVLMDVTASLRLFGGPLALCQKIQASVAALGFSAAMGAAPTAMGAWLLARAPAGKGALARRRTLKLTTMARRLDHLPCPLLPAARPYQEWLKDIGADRLGALRRLPRAGLQRRTAKHVLEQLDRAYGQAPELFEWIRVPLTFSERIETFDRIEHADALLFGAQRLLLQMVGWLVSLQQAVKVFSFSLEHERGRAAIAPTILDITLGEPAWRAEHLVRLLKERLGKVELAAPVIALRLDARQLVAMLPPTQSLFPEPGGSPADFNRLLELLTARLGRDNVLSPASLHDHRPEVCNAWLPATGKLKKESEEDEMIERPFWILPKPIPLLLREHRPFYGSPLKLIDGPERVEAGWWNDQIAARDYFIAQAGDASCYWIYLERSGDARWFLHGLYA